MKEWRHRFASECTLCKERRNERNRLLASGDPTIHETNFVDAPYVHRNNEPKYVVANVRAEEVAKRNREYCYWFRAEDTILNPDEKPKDGMKMKAKLERFLQMHDTEERCFLNHNDFSYIGCFRKCSRRIWYVSLHLS